MLYATGLVASLMLAGLANSQGHYADNQATLLQDSEAVAANFPDVEGVTLYSPAFLNPEAVPAGFQNGTSGPTDEAAMGRVSHSKALRGTISNLSQNIFSAPSQHVIAG